MTKKTEKTTIYYGRPADRSLEAFKEFINAMVAKLAPDAPDTMTEEKWKAAHKKFWAKADSKDEQKEQKKVTVYPEDDLTMDRILSVMEKRKNSTKKEQEKTPSEEEVFTKEDFMKALKKATRKQKPSREKGKKGTSE